MCTSRKISFTADQAAHQARSMNHRAYHCNKCGAWHTTSQKRQRREERPSISETISNGFRVVSFA